MLNETESKKKKEALRKEALKKDALRQEFLHKRRLFVQSKGSSLVQVHSQLVDYLEAIFPKAFGSKTFGIAATYFPKQDEADPNGVAERLSGWQFAYPRVEGEHLRFWIPEGAQAFLTGFFGINEPIVEQSCPASLEDCQVILVPGVVFDRRGGRIGYGKGFYDRTLKNCQGLKIGVGYTAQMSAENLPVNSADVYMDWIVTEEFAIETKLTKGDEDEPASKERNLSNGN